MADQNSLHSNLTGYMTVLAARSTEDKIPQLEEMSANHCDKCHTSCGQCHVSIPTNLGGGLVAGHEFKKIPPMNLTCTGCHGSRIENEYKGKNEGVKADVHWMKAGMPCFDCHPADEMHGALGEPGHRYDGPPTPGCQDPDCHPGVAAGDGNMHHTEGHLEAMSVGLERPPASPDEAVDVLRGFRGEVSDLALPSAPVRPSPERPPAP